MATTKIFISYRRDDTADEAKQLQEQLENLHEQVFRDVAAIDVGEKFPKRIMAALKEAGFVIVVIGKRWLNITDERGRRRLENPNDFVRREIKYSLGRAERDKFLDIIPFWCRVPECPGLSNFLMICGHLQRSMPTVSFPRLSPTTLRSCSNGFIHSQVNTPVGQTRPWMSLTKRSEGRLLARLYRCVRWLPGNRNFAIFPSWPHGIARSSALSLQAAGSISNSRRGSRWPSTGSSCQAGGTRLRAIGGWVSGGEDLSF